MSDHMKIAFAIKYLFMSHLGDDVISHVTIAEIRHERKSRGTRPRAVES